MKLANLPISKMRAIGNRHDCSQAQGCLVELGWNYNQLDILCLSYLDVVLFWLHPLRGHLQLSHSLWALHLPLLGLLPHHAVRASPRHDQAWAWLTPWSWIRWRGWAPSRTNLWFDLLGKWVPPWYWLNHWYLRHGILIFMTGLCKNINWLNPTPSGYMSIHSH